MWPLTPLKGPIEQIQCSHVLFIFRRSTVIVPFRTMWCGGLIFIWVWLQWGGIGRLMPKHHALCRLPCALSVFRLILYWLSLGFCLKAVVVIAAGAGAEERNMDHRFARSTVWSWRTCPVAAAGRISRWAWVHVFKGVQTLKLQLNWQSLKSNVIKSAIMNVVLTNYWAIKKSQ